MNILWLYRYTAHRQYNHWFHTDFAKEIAKQENINLKFYGYNLEKDSTISDLLLIPYQKDITMKDLKQIFDYDIIVLDCYNRAYTTVQITKMWLPEDFKDINIPKIVIEGDYHNIKNPSWYLDLNINLILHRHLTNVTRANEDLPITSLWLPCSIDNTIFKPNPEIIRINKICAIGEYNNKVYEYRKRALKILMNNNLAIKENLLIEENYIKCLQSYISHLNGSSVFNLDMAKMFEIMASGSVLLTDKNDLNGITKLFPNDSYCTYNKNYSDLILKGNKIINEPNYRKYLINNAIECINNKHTHKIRAKEFINIINLGEF